VRTTWQLDRDPRQVLELLRTRLAAADDVTAVEYDGTSVIVRSRDVPLWAYLLSVLAPRGLIDSVILRARTDRVLRITPVGSSLELEGETNAGVSKALVMTKNEVLPPKSDAGR
jgi:hypothetical protein